MKHEKRNTIRKVKIYINYQTIVIDKQFYICVLNTDYNFYIIIIVANTL